ncbi:unnamed protein product [Rotaria sordida]|uniref:Uncharacterized protein n=1 Tax=Rotaria sordida TaxID=392033 RepID=A0A814WIF0_9BILA|nr:unnamed protein product [Rotaria sordida]
MINPALEIEPNDINTNSSYIKDYIADQQSLFKYNSSDSKKSHLNGISMPSEYKIDQFNDNHIYDDDDELSNDAQDKKFEELDDIDTVQQIQTNMTVPSGAAEMTQQTSVHHRWFTFLSKIPFVIPNNNTETQSPYDAIVGIINYFVLLGFLSILCYWIAWASWIMAAERQVRRIRYALFRNILRQEIGWFDVHNTGELSNRLIRDLNTIKDGINDNIADLITLLARMLGALVYILAIGWKLTLVALSLLPLMIIAFKMIVKTTVNYSSKEIQAFASASSVSQEVLQNIRTVTAFHGQAKEEERFAKNLILAKNIGIKKALHVGIWLGLGYLSVFVSYALIFWYGSQLVRTDCTNYSVGIVLVVFMGYMYASFHTAYLSPHIQNFAEALTSGSYVFDIIDRQTKIDVSSDEGDKPQNIIGDIEFDNVTFTYPARQETPILNKLSLKIPSGKIVALVGASGCGKSTIIQLIQRFYDPDEGRILLDGKDIKTLNVSWLRSHIGIVSQEPVLFTGSIEDNIRFGKPNATDDEVQTAAKMANAHDFIMEFPENYKTSSGDKLSGGQKQRVAIARALVSNPKILLLDEATSALDNTSERIVQDALDKAKQGRTTIVIAHRLSTIRNADLIIGLEHGRVIEYGIHDDLMEHKGFYYELVITQTQKEEQADLDSDQEDDKMEEEFVRQRLSIYLFVEPNLEEQKRLTNIYTASIFLIGLTLAVTQLLINVGFAKSGEELTMRMRKLTFSAILRQEMSYFGYESNSIGALITCLSTDASSLKHATQAIEHIRTIVALHQEKHFIDLYENVFNQEFKKQMCRLHLIGIGAGVVNSAIYFVYMATFSYGNKLVKDGDMKFDEVIRILVAITCATVTIGRAIAMIPDYSKAQQAALKILRLNQRQSEINPHDESGIILDKVIGSIKFHDVHFRYPSRPTFRILRNFSLKCSTGRTTALVGPSGSGKSTIIGLLQRLYDPLKGNVLLDGHNIKHLNLRWLRSLMGFVQQEPVLFNLSIYDNIAYGDNSRQITQDGIETAARMANIHELIISLPKGYETLCGAKGSQLSGGQKQ